MKKEITSNVIILDGKDIIKRFEAKYGKNPIVSRKYDSVKNSVEKQYTLGTA